MIAFYPARPVGDPHSGGFFLSDRGFRKRRSVGGGFAAMPWIVAFFWCTFFLIPIADLDAETSVNDDLITATESEGKAVARALHQYHLKQIEIEDKGIDLNDGTMLGGKYRYDLNTINIGVNEAFARLQSRVLSITGMREGSREKAERIAIHWRKEMYGFGTAGELAEQIATRRAVAWIVVAGLCLGLGSIARRIGKPDDDQTPLTVPADLKTVEVPGLRYRVNLVTGLVMDKEMWDEVKTTTTYIQGTFGNQTGEIRTESVRKGKAFLLTHDGKEDVLNLTGHGHDYRPGNIVTFLFCRRRGKRKAIVAYNHATGKTEEMNGLDQAHGSLWKLNLAVTAVVGYLVFDWAAEPMQQLGVDHSGWIFFKAVGLAVVFTAIVHFVKLWRRNRRFRIRFEPRLVRFLQDGDVEVRKTFGRLVGSELP